MSTGSTNDSEPKTVELRVHLLRIAGPAVIATDIESALFKQLSDTPVAIGETVFKVQCAVPHQVFALAAGDELI